MVYHEDECGIINRFKEFYSLKLRHKYNELENVRGKYLKKFALRLSCMTLIGAVLWYIIISNYDGESVFNSICLALFVVFFAWNLAALSPSDGFKKETKHLVMNEILEFFGDFEYFYKDETLVSAEEIKKSELFDFDSFYTDDGFRGKYMNTDITISEQVLSGDTREGNKDTVFRGVFISLKFNKKFSGHTIVRAIVPKNPWLLALLLCGVMLMAVEPLHEVSPADMLQLVFFTTFFATLCWLAYKKRKFKSVKLESSGFSKNWKVSSTNQVEARCILTPAFMECIQNLKALFHGKKVDLSFFDNHILIAIHTKEDMFETTSLFSSALKYSKVEDVIRQLYNIFLIIDVLQLDSKKDKNIALQGDGA